MALKKQKQSPRANVMCVGVEITNDLENPSRTRTATDEVKKGDDASLHDFHFLRG